VTFGGAYAVLPYVAQQAVDKYGWLEPGQMMDGLGLAETTPGPLITVLQFCRVPGGEQPPDTMAPEQHQNLPAATWALNSGILAPLRLEPRCVGLFRVNR
jgi:chromate transporter